MALLIDEIILPESIGRDYTGDPPFNSLKGCKKLNVIIGPNNSGKSRLLRELFFRAEDLRVAPYSPNATLLHDAIVNTTDFIESCKGNFRQGVSSSLEAIHQILTSGPKWFAKLGSGFPKAWAVSQEQALQSAVADVKRHIADGYGHYQSHVNDELLSKLASFELAKTNAFSESRDTVPKKLYIPTLRGLRPLEKSENVSSTYFDRTWHDYFEGGGQVTIATEDAKKLVLTGLGLYEIVKQKLLGTVNDRKLVSAFEAFLSKSFFDSRPVTLIPRHGGDTLDVKIGKEAQRPITRLGDGVQQLIILTWPIFQAQNTPLFLFIEEPDLFLHPGYQRLFINTILNSQNPNLFVFATTHSNQFLDLTLESQEIAVFRCEKLPNKEEEEEHEPKFKIENAGEANKELLKHVGVTPSSMMLANCTIWVEGITDRLYLGRYLQLYLKQELKSYHENLHYMFVEYSGGNITHWSFLDEDGPKAERLSANMMLVADDDNPKGKKKDRHDQLKAALGDCYIKLSTREIENTLTPEVIRGVIKSYEGDEVELNDFKQSEYNRSMLGKFIDNKVLSDIETSKRYQDSVSKCRHASNATGYADSSGTVKGKVQFCKKALAHLNDFSDLSKEAQRVTKLLAEFVIEHNPR